MNQNERMLFLIKALLKENPQYSQIRIPNTVIEQKKLLRGLMNVRMPRQIDATFLQVQDAYLKEEIANKGIVDLKDLTPICEHLYLWQGDITTLKCDAIVNAANSGMTGCYVPNHHCIDNCIHTFAGIQLRLECDQIMHQQGHEEETGSAKLTKAYNLPCRYVLHTVGPIVSESLKQNDCMLLRQCYQSCLQLATENHLESIAFCCISTGEFHFPHQEAAEIAVQTVKTFLKKETSVKKVVFNVFKEEDRRIYETLLS